MQNKKAVPTWVSAVMFVLTVVSTIYYIIQVANYIVDREPVYRTVTMILFCLAAIVALTYTLFGFTKHAANAYKLFCVLYLIYSLILVLSRATGGLTIFVLLSVISFGAVCVHVFARDMGRTKSFILAGVIFLCNVIDAALCLTHAVKYALVGNVVLALSLLIMIYAKYKDKTARGREV